LLAFSIATIFELAVALVTIQIMKSEKQLIERELEIMIQYDKF
tara:strand:- start:311 stop:439 length:129 start_codon:yes stop_codon:yes gene_type:complete